MFHRPARIGLEVGARTLRVAWRTTPRGESLRLRYREHPRSQEATPEALSNDLSELLRPLHRQRFRAHLVLSAPSSSMRWLTIHVPDVSRVAEAVAEQLPALVPFEVERAQVQFLVRRQQRLGEELECTVSLAACERAALQQDLGALWRIGWAPSEVMPAALALVHTAHALNAIDQAPVVLMDIGERRTTIALVDQREVIYARDVSLGDDHLTDVLMEHVSIGERTLSLSREQAEALKTSVGIPELSAGPIVHPATQRDPMASHPSIPLATYVAMLQPILEQLVGEVRRTMTFGAHAAMTAGPQRILLSGVGSRLPHIEEWLSKQLAVPVSRLRCDSLLGSQGSLAAVACGLALGERSSPLNLQPPEWRRRWQLTWTAALAWRGLLAVALVVWLGSGAWSLRRLTLTRQLSAFTTQRADLQPVIELHAAIEARTQLIQRLAGRGVSLEWLQRLANEFPKPIRLTRLALEAESKVSMVGEAQEREQAPEAAVSELTLQLERTRLCRGVQLGSTHRVGTSGKLLEFALTCQRP